MGHNVIHSQINYHYYYYYYYYYSAEISTLQRYFCQRVAGIEGVSVSPVGKRVIGI
jgi:hypothetical protein